MISRLASLGWAILHDVWLMMSNKKSAASRGSQRFHRHVNGLTGIYFFADSADF
ncbi:hypothetical protein CZ787_18725 [Halomonas citrativorans]|uniref:Uncharacterized protein n=1 Tax=Halomonas citrativorans TaxID=2742612 RepID=A0A1R4I5R6_9GAMM|nr:hypothetical protein CZ787_18725 [Halomonas citrativorans]